MGWFKDRKDDIVNSPFFMAGTNRKIAEMESDSLLPLEVIGILNKYDERRDEAKDIFDSSESEQEAANKEAEKYLNEYENAKTQFETIKKQRGIFGKFFTSKIATVLLGGTAAAVSLLSLGALGGLALTLGTVGLKMLGSAAYCNLTMTGKEYTRLKRTIKISKAKYNYYNDISNVRGKDAEIALKEMKKIDKHKNEFEKAIVLQSKNYKEEFKLIREFDQLDPQKRFMFQQAFGDSTFDKLNQYIDLVRDNWFYNNNGIDRTCNINDLTNILEKLRKGKNVEVPNSTINQFVNNQLPVPNVTRPQPQPQPQPQQTPIDLDDQKNDAGDTNKTRGTDFRNGWKPPVIYSDYGLDRRSVEELAKEANINSPEEFLAVMAVSWKSDVDMEVLGKNIINKEKEKNNPDDETLGRYANEGASLLREMLDGNIENEKLEPYIKLYMDSMTKINLDGQSQDQDHSK